MNTAVKVFLSMSLSGGLLILGLLAGRRFLWRKVSRQWRYYIWLPAPIRAGNNTDWYAVAGCRKCLRANGSCGAECAGQGEPARCRNDNHRRVAEG